VAGRRGFLALALGVVITAGLAPVLIAPAADASAGYSHVALAFHPVAYWRLGERSGTAAFDNSPNGNDGTYQGGPSLGEPGAITRDPNTSAGFGGKNDDVVWGPSSRFRGSFTVLAWIDNTGSTENAEQTFFDTRTPTAEFSFDFKLSSGNLKVDVGDGSRWFLTGPGIPQAFKLDTWYQVAAVVRSTHVTLYVNGRSIGSESYPFGTGTPLLFDQSHRVYLGTNARYTSEQFLGHLDEVAIYPKPLTAGQITGLYQSGIAG
jgi:hypothetical protein